VGGWVTVWEDDMSDPGANWSKYGDPGEGVVTFNTGNIDLNIKGNVSTGWSSACRPPLAAYRSSGGISWYSDIVEFEVVLSGVTVQRAGSYHQGFVGFGWGSLTGYRNVGLGVYAGSSGAQLHTSMRLPHWGCAGWSTAYPGGDLRMRIYRSCQSCGTVKLPTPELYEIIETNRHLSYFSIGGDRQNFVRPSSWPTTCQASVEFTNFVLWAGNIIGTPVVCPTPPSTVDAYGYFTYARVRKYSAAASDVDAPFITDETPTGSIGDNYADVTFTTKDSDGDVVKNTINVSVEELGGGPTVNMIVNGVFQSGYSGTIVANSYNGWDVVIDRAAPWIPGKTYEVTATCQDDSTNQASKDWQFGISEIPFYIIDVQPDPITEEGGTEMTATGLFPVNEPLELFMGYTGDDTDAPCYGGEGYGYQPQTESSSEVHFMSPPNAPGSPCKVTLKYLGAVFTYESGVTVLERVWRTKQLSTKAAHPPWIGAGKRQLGDENPR